MAQLLFSIMYVSYPRQTNDFCFSGLEEESYVNFLCCHEKWIRACLFVSCTSEERFLCLEDFALFCTGLPFIHIKYSEFKTLRHNPAIEAWLFCMVQGHQSSLYSSTIIYHENMIARDTAKEKCVRNYHREEAFGNQFWLKADQTFSVIKIGHHSAIRTNGLLYDILLI